MQLDSGLERPVNTAVIRLEPEFVPAHVHPPLVPGTQLDLTLVLPRNVICATSTEAAKAPLPQSELRNGIIPGARRL